MRARRLLLIDNDGDFERLLREQLTPYGFEIHQIQPSNEALSHVPKLAPDVLFIAVEEPDKLGYSLCNKAKKSVARDLPVVLTTVSVPPSGFQSHRRLKVHADEYIDKRTMNSDEVMKAIDALVGLGAPSDIDMPLEIEEVDIEEAEVLDEDIDVNALVESADDNEKTRIAPPDIVADVFAADASLSLADDPDLADLADLGDLGDLGDLEDIDDLDVEFDMNLDAETATSQPAVSSEKNSLVAPAAEPAPALELSLDDDAADAGSEFAAELEPTRALGVSPVSAATTSTEEALPEVVDSSFELETETPAPTAEATPD